MAEFLSLSPADVPQAKLHGYLLGAVAPRPIAFASTIDREGRPNLAPFSFFNVFSSNPPVCIFSPARRGKDKTIKHTYMNVMEIPEVVINVVSYTMVEQMNLASTEYPRGVDEFIKAGFTPIASEIVQPLRVKEAPAQLECRVTEIKPLGRGGGAGNLIFAEVVRMHISTAVLGPDGAIDPQLIDLVGRMGKDWYVRASGSAVFEVEKPLASPLGMGIDALPEHIRHSAVLTGNELGRLGNMPALPDEAALRTFFEHSENQRLVKEIHSRDDLHRKAAQLIAENRKETALMLLLCEQFMFR